ncbi:MAG: hypothetical protein Q8R91_04115 [Candidatus Omnitrophota bacterium]|nr:hypothetical protein [Candidatus Omnitrophota bacterium]
MAHAGRLASSLLLGLVLSLGTSVWAEDAEHVEVILKVDQGGITVLRQMVRPGRVPGPRHLELRKGFWLLQARDAQGQNRYTTAIGDPRVIIAETYAEDRLEPGRLVGRTAVSETAVFSVRLPNDPTITALRISQLTRSVEQPPPPDGNPARRLLTARAVPSLPADALQLLADVRLEAP